MPSFVSYGRRSASMTDRPLVSVVVTAYNRERFLGAAIESVVAQTFADLEIIVVDDCSTDGTRDVAHAYAAREARLRVVANERNLGDYANRNHAASFARGVFLKYHDSDDVMYPHCLETMVGPLVAHSDVALGLSGHRAWPGGPCPMRLTPRMCYQREFFGGGLFGFGPASALFRTEAFRALGGFPESGPHSDFLFWLHACARVNVLLLPTDLYWYRVHDGQHLQSAAAARDSLPLFDVVWRALADPLCPLTPEERERARAVSVFRVAKALRGDVRRFRWSLALDRLRHGPRLWDWARYLRRPQREALAGTPFDSTGDFIVPDWRGGRGAGDARLS
jgi:glycosyltransferase involved in cell wall biosynthesis